MTNPIVVDLSHWQPDPDWNALRDGGTLGVIHKATEGTSIVDECYGYRENAAKAAGLLWLSYHYLHHGQIPEQMDFYLETADPLPGARLIIDFEEPDTSFQDLEAAAEYLLARGYEVTIYGSNHLVSAVDGEVSDTLSKTSLWQARYSQSEPDVPVDIWPWWSLWQYSDGADVTGIDGPVDANRWNGDIEGLIEWFGNGAPPAPVTDVPIVRLDVTVSMSAPVELQLFVNGEQIVTDTVALPLTS